MKQQRIRLFDVMADWKVSLLCPMGFRWGNLFYTRSTVILQKLGINLGWESGDDFQEAVQGGSSQIRKSESKYVTRWRLVNLWKMYYNYECRVTVLTQ